MLGFVGVGQSSWGPILYAFAEHNSSPIVELNDRLRKQFDLDQSSLFWTKASNHGATLLWEG
jgi:predicted sugar kinase